MRVANRVLDAVPVDVGRVNCESQLSKLGVNRQNKSYAEAALLVQCLPLHQSPPGDAPGGRAHLVAAFAGEFRTALRFFAQPLPKHENALSAGYRQESRFFVNA